MTDDSHSDETMTPMNFRTLSIKGKLMLITMLTSSVALLVASAGFLVYDLVAFRDRMSQDLMTEARIIGANSAAGLAFHDERAVGEILAALKARDETVAAALYTPNGELFAVIPAGRRSERCRRGRRAAVIISRTTVSKSPRKSCCTGNRSARCRSCLTCATGMRASNAIQALSSF